MSHPVLAPSPAEQAHRDQLMRRLLDAIKVNRTIKLPPFDPSIARPSDQFALVSIGLEPNEYAGSLGRFRYQFEGEEDLLHLIVTDVHQGRVTTEEGQAVAAFVLNGLPPALIWLKPGDFSQHFYFGHDELLDNCVIPS